MINNSTVMTGVFRDLTNRGEDRATHDVDAKTVEQHPLMSVLQAVQHIGQGVQDVLCHADLNKTTTIQQNRRKIVENGKVETDV